MQANFYTPVLLTIWNRPDAINRIMKVLEKVKPPALFLVADYGRSLREQKVIQESIKIAENVSWKCKVVKSYSKSNMGPRLCVSNGINSFFTIYDRGIILEHDCLPSESFFYFCQDLLNKYEKNHEVMHISGNNFDIFQNGNESSYYFSTIPHIWGFATWKRAWKYYDVEMKSYIQFRNLGQIKNIFPNVLFQRYWGRIFNKCYLGSINTWDYQWTYAIMNKNGLCITPRKNLVTNIGFGETAANMKDEKHPFSALPLESIEDIIHPMDLKRCIECDEVTMKRIFGVTIYSELFRPMIYRLFGIALYLTHRDYYNKIKYS